MLLEIGLPARRRARRKTVDNEAGKAIAEAEQVIAEAAHAELAADLKAEVDNQETVIPATTETPGKQVEVKKGKRPEKPSRRRSPLRRIIQLAIVGFWAYVLFVRPRMIRWGATDNEIIEHLPGDKEVINPRYETTHAVTINAPTRFVWPWIVQIGFKRGGFYSYDWLERISGLRGLRSTDQVIPDYQYLKAGDIVPLAPGMDLPVKSVKKNKALVLAFHGPVAGAEWFLKGISWAFVLSPLNDNTTRLVTRVRASYDNPRATFYFWLVLAVQHFIMERKMLLGIKARAEQLAADQESKAKVPVGAGAVKA